MKKLVNKLRRKSKTTAAEEQSAAPRITNETVAEHRERILAGGRRFKYPMQHPKHHVVLITVLIVLAVLVTVASIFTWQLYRSQNTSRFAYSATAVVPFPVANVDGSLARYSDYLLELRSALHYLSTKENINFSSDDGKRLLAYQKRQALNKTEQNAYIHALAKDHGIKVTSKEVDDFIESETNNSRLGVNQRVYEQVIRDYYDWSMGEYRRSIANQLLRKKVIARVDTQGRQKVDQLQAGLKAGGDFSDAATEHSNDPAAKATGGDTGVVPLDTDDPSGLIAAAEKLQPGQVSDVITGVDGFYIIKLTDKQPETIRFSKIFIKYTQFDNNFAALKRDDKIKEYITVEDAAAAAQR